MDKMPGRLWVHETLDYVSEDKPVDKDQIEEMHEYVCMSEVQKLLTSFESLIDVITDGIPVGCKAFQDVLSSSQDALSTFQSNRSDKAE